MSARNLLHLQRRITATTTATTTAIVRYQKIGVKHVSSDALQSEVLEESGSDKSDGLKSRIFRLRVPKRSATNITQKWINEGNSVTVSELRSICRDLRRSHRFKHALEIR